MFSGINMAICVMLSSYELTWLLRFIMEHSLMCFVNKLLSMKFLFSTTLSVVMYMIELDRPLDFFLAGVIRLLVC